MSESVQSVLEKIGKQFKDLAEAEGNAWPPGSTAFERENGRVKVFDTLRAFQVINRPLSETKIWHYDPQADEELNEPQEETMRQMGPAEYLKWIMREYQVTLNFMPRTEHDCRRAARIVVRAIPSYKGEKYIQ